MNASSTGWLWTKLSSEALNKSVTSTRIDNVPGYFGIVIVPPLFNRALRRRHRAAAVELVGGRGACVAVARVRGGGPPRFRRRGPSG